MTHDALMTLIHARQRQDGLAAEALPRHGYLLCSGQPVGVRAKTLALLRHGRETLRQRQAQGKSIPRVETQTLGRAAMEQRGQMHRN
jgi:hypothetical protein